MNIRERVRSSGYLKIFLICLALGTVLLLPFIIAGGGIFVYYGDYNAQQIPFYQLAHEAVRDGNIGWSWTTDLGANFMGSYSFYLLGSPFFWLTLPFPTEAVPYLMGPLLILKLACCGVTGFALIRRFTKTDHFAMIGALLYAFSGFNVYNIFFNHFLEVAVFFPLLLIALEEFVVNGRRGVFALTVCLNVVVNYYFFVGQVLFVVLYFIVRCFSPDFRMTLRKFLMLALEAILGLLAAAALLLPSALAIMGNYRLDERLSGFNYLFYNQVQRYGLIFESFFMPPDIPANPNFFPDSNSKWASVSTYLPLVSMSGVIAYFRSKKARWIKALLLICAVMAFIPVLNSAFQLFNSQYYARWFYMPVLIMALATVLALEDSTVDYNFGLKVTGIIIASFGVIGILPKENDAGELVFFSMPAYVERYWAYMAIGLGGIVVAALLYHLYHKDRLMLSRTMLIASSVTVVVYGLLMLGLGSINQAARTELIEHSVKGKENITLSTDEEYYRIDVYNAPQNQGLYWGFSSLQTFHSVVPSSIMEFYRSLGMQRGVKSDPDIRYLALRNLLSTKYLFVSEKTNVEELHLPNYTFTGEQNGYDVYKNKNYVPLGFTYDYYITPDMYESYYEEHRDQLLMRAILLDEEQIKEYGDLLDRLTAENHPTLSDNELTTDAADRRAESSSECTVSGSTMTSKITLQEENLVFYSVPYEDGWSATVNGEEVAVEQVNVGFMAVRAPAGENTIVFTYRTPGLQTGVVISLGSFVVLGVYYLFICRYWKRNPEKRPVARAHRYSQTDSAPIPASQAYLRNILRRGKSK